MRVYRFPNEGQAPATLLLMAAGAGLFLLHLLTTRIQDFIHDLDAHLIYIRFIAEHGWIPIPGERGLYAHPPLYYIMEAAVFTLSTVLGVADPMASVCFLSLGFYIIYLYFSAKLLQENVRSRNAYYASLVVLGIFFAISGRGLVTVVVCLALFENSSDTFGNVFKTCAC